MNERDWLAELVAAGVIAPAEAIDANGNQVYQLVGFPDGEEGLRLRRLFDRHVQGRGQ